MFKLITAAVFKYLNNELVKQQRSKNNRVFILWVSGRPSSVKTSRHYASHAEH